MNKKYLLKQSIDDMQPHRDLSIKQPVLDDHHHSVSILNDPINAYHHWGSFKKLWFWCIIGLIIFTVGCSKYEDHVSKSFNQPLSKRTLAYDKRIYNKLYPPKKNPYTHMTNASSPNMNKDTKSYLKILKTNVPKKNHRKKIIKKKYNYANNYANNNQVDYSATQPDMTGTVQNSDPNLQTDYNQNNSISPENT